MPSCNHCHSDPCHRVLHEDLFRSYSALLGDVAPNVARRNLYQAYTYAVHGRLGRGNRVVIPDCVVELIRELFPDPDGEYMGHMDA